jgi:putative nucleotidyltransferase with HDIG domain
MRAGNLAALAGNAAAVVAIWSLIAATGGLPSQLAHLYYIPVVLSALLLPVRPALAVAVLAAVAVSPLPDVLVRAPLGLDPYYPDPAPWNLSPQGWVVRPLAFFAVSILASQFIKEARARATAEARAQRLSEHLAGETAGRMAAEQTSSYRARELKALRDVDRMILRGASEEEAFRTIAELAAGVTGATHAAVVVPGRDGEGVQAIYGHNLSESVRRMAERGLPLREGVSGWTLQHGRPATSVNVFEDPRYEEMAPFARAAGYTAAAAVPIILGQEVLGALAVGYAEERCFSGEEIATLQGIADQAAIAVGMARQKKSLKSLVHETATALADAIESRDPYTGDHCQRLARYAKITARQLDLPEQEVEIIRLGAALHDIGKIVVPDNILKKPGKLTPDEYAVMKQHCYSGGQICKRVSFLQPAYHIVYHHHERYDGRGYPDGLKGEQIPLGARIVSVADAFDAITSNRPYRKGMGDEEAEAILRDGAGSQWDPVVVDAFLYLVTGPPAQRLQVKRVAAGIEE